MTVRKSAPATASDVLARTARALRGDHKADEVARAVTALGLKWGTGRVADLEAGKVNPSLPTLLTLCQAFADVLGRPMELADLFAGEGQVSINPNLVVDLSEVRSALAGSPVALPKPNAPTAKELLHAYLADRPDFGDDSVTPARRVLLWDIWSAYGETEERAARALGVEKFRLVEIMADCWASTLTAERDRIAGPDATAQKRGHVARQLRKDLRKALTDGDN